LAQFIIPGETHDTLSPLKKLYGFLADFSHFRSILPDDKVENFEFSDSECSFNIRGITPMKVSLQEKHPYDYILFTSQALGKYKFTLRAQFIGDPDSPGKCNVEMGGELNPVILKMAENALKNLVNTMSFKLSQLQLS
jgi:hypothetical protein